MIVRHKAQVAYAVTVRNSYTVYTVFYLAHMKTSGID